MRRILTEIAFDHAGIIDAAVDGWGGVDAMIKHDGHLPAKILLREGPKAVRRIAGERKIHDPLAGIVGVAIFRGAAKVAACDDRRPGKDVPLFAIWWSAGSRASFRTSGDKLRTGGQNAAVLAQCVGFRGVDGGILDEPKLELATLLNDTSGSGRIAFAGQLHKDFVAISSAAKLN